MRWNAQTPLTPSSLCPRTLGTGSDIVAPCAVGPGDRVEEGGLGFVNVQTSFSHQFLPHDAVVEVRIILLSLSEGDEKKNVWKVVK